MECEAQVIIKTKKILHYLLEKINLRDWSCPCFIALRKSYEQHKSSRALRNIKIVVISKHIEHSLSAHGRGYRINACLTETIEPISFRLAIKNVAAVMFVLQKNTEKYRKISSSTNSSNFWSIYSSCMSGNSSLNYFQNIIINLWKLQGIHAIIA